MIAMLLTTPAIKVGAMRVHGGETAEVRLVGGNYNKATEVVMRLVVEEGLTLIHLFDDSDVITGQGTIGECKRGVQG